MLMALHPKVQAKCQNELSEVIGEKPPTIEDMKDLKYVMATVMEIQRYCVLKSKILTKMLRRKNSEILQINDASSKCSKIVL